MDEMRYMKGVCLLKYMKVVTATLLAAAISLSSWAVASGPLMAEDETLKLTRKTFVDKAVDYSGTVKELDIQLEKLVNQHDSMNKMLEGLEQLYNTLDDYTMLYDLAIYTQEKDPSYWRYLQLTYRLANNEILTPEEMLEVQTLALTYGDLSNPDPNLIDPTYMTIMQYGMYVNLSPAFEQLGLANPHLTKAEEYDMFIYPLEVAPIALQNGITQLKRGIELAKVGTATGMGQLYDSYGMLTGYLELQEENYNVAKDNYEADKIRHELGRLSDADYEASANALEIAKLNRDKMQRQLDNLKMNMNRMIGREPDAPLKVQVTNQAFIPNKLDDVDVYTNRALKERNEILTQEEAIYAKQVEMTEVDKFFSESKDVYKATALQLDVSKSEMESIKNDIRIEIISAYQNVLETQKAVDVAKDEFDAANRQYNVVKTNMQLGFVTASALSQVQMLVSNSLEGYNTAVTNYEKAYEDLINASHIGPAYQPEGGMTLE